MMGDSCGICSHWPENWHCTWCDDYICEGCADRLAQCAFCNQGDLCPKCIEPDDHDCTMNPADIIDADEEEE